MKINLIKSAAAALLLTLTVSAARAGWLDDLRGKWDSFRAGQSAVKIPADLTGATGDLHFIKVAFTGAVAGKVLSEEPDPDHSKMFYSVSGDTISVFVCYEFHYRANRFGTRTLVGKADVSDPWGATAQALTGNYATITVSARKGKVLTGVLNGLLFQDQGSSGKPDEIKDAPVTITLK